MGDLGPQARFEFENPSFGQTIEATIFFNQSITDFNASQDLLLSGMTLASSTPVPGSTTSHQLVFNRASFTPGTLSLKLLGNSITDSFGMPNSEVEATIDFRPHRVREGNLALWWKLDENTGALAVDSAGGDFNGTGSPIWFAPGKFGASGIEFDGTDGKALLSTGVSGDFESATLSLWVYPESPDFHLFSLGELLPPCPFPCAKQRPLFTLDGLDQQSLPGTSADEFWAKGYLPLNQWSHLSLVYDLSSRTVRFYLNGSFDNESSFSGGKPSLNQAFRLGPRDGSEALASQGKIDDLRIYGMALSDHEAVRVFGGGSGDFYQRSIEISQGAGYEMPVIATVRFLEDGFPVAIDGFDSADYSVSNATGTAPTKISDGVYEVGLTPNDQTSPVAMNLSVTGTGISTLFNEALP